MEEMPTLELVVKLCVRCCFIRASSQASTAARPECCHTTVTTAIAPRGLPVVQVESGKRQVFCISSSFFLVVFLSSSSCSVFLLCLPVFSFFFLFLSATKGRKASGVGCVDKLACLAAPVACLEPPGCGHTPCTAGGCCCPGPRPCPAWCPPCAGSF